MDIAEVLSSPRTETIDRSIISTPWSKDAPSHLDIIPGSSRSSLMDSPTPAPREVRRLRDALDKRTHQYDLVLIDCPPSLNGLTRWRWRPPTAPWWSPSRGSSRSPPRTVH